MVWDLISSFEGETIIGGYHTAVVLPSFSCINLTLVCLEVEKNIELKFLDGAMAHSLQLPASSSLRHLI